MRYAVVDIRLSELHTKQVSVPPWEVPILKIVHGDGVEVVDEIDVDREPPEAQDEYRRLAARYSPNKEEANSAVALAYGTYEAGFSALEKEIGKSDAAHPAGNAKRERLAGVDERQKAELEAFKAKQKDERKAAERDADEREQEREKRDKREKQERELAQPRPSPAPQHVQPNATQPKATPAK